MQPIFPKTKDDFRFESQLCCVGLVGHNEKYPKVETRWRPMPDFKIYKTSSDFCLETL